MRHLTVITILLVSFAGCDSSVSSTQSPNALLSSQQGGLNSLSSTTPNDPLYSQQDYLNTANVPQAWQVTNGSFSEKIAIISLGGVAASHEDLNSRVTIKRAAGSPVADNGAGNPATGIIGAATNNGKGIAGVNWNSPVLSYNIAKETTGKVDQLPSGIPITKTYADLNESAVAPAINSAVNDGAKTIYLPLYWLLESQIPNVSISDFQFYPCCKTEDPYRQLLDNVVNIFNSIFAANKQNNNYQSAIGAVKNAYESGSVVVSGALPYDGILPLGFPANLASDHVVLTVGGYDPEENEPFQFSATPEGDDVSNDSKDINLIAPGVDLQTTLPDGNQYGDVSGTYGSAALTTGIISLLQSAEGDLTPDDVTHILEKTALPLGSSDYDDQGGFGLIDAGAAMDFVDTYDIKHAVATNGQAEKVSEGESITLYPSVWNELSIGIYIGDKYEVTYNIPLIPSSDNDLWFNAKGTLGWSEANPNDQNRYADVELFNDHAEVTTYIYKLFDRYGRDVGWHPASPETAQLSYSYVGEKPALPLDVIINGVPYANDGQTLSFSANVSNADGSVSYQWYYRRETYSPWTSAGTGSTFQHTFYSAPGGGTAHSGVKLEVTSPGETATDVLSVDVYGCQNGFKTQGDSLGSNIIIPC